jgi:hypothetical protein
VLRRLELGAEKKRGWAQRRRVRFIGDAAGSGGRVTGGATRGRGMGGMGPAQRSGGACASGMRPAVKQGRAGADRWAPLQSRAATV